MYLETAIAVVALYVKLVKRLHAHRYKVEIVFNLPSETIRAETGVRVSIYSIKGIIPIRINHFSSHRNISKFSKTSRIKVKDDLNFYRQAQIS